jgi:long-chain acyl-CoA synthetase
VVRSDPNLSSEMILAHFRENLARYKIPRQIEFRTELPKTPIGKILRSCLRDEKSVI